MGRCSRPSTQFCWDARHASVLDAYLLADLGELAAEPFIFRAQSNPGDGTEREAPMDVSDGDPGHCDGVDEGVGSVLRPLTWQGEGWGTSGHGLSVA